VFKKKKRKFKKFYEEEKKRFALPEEIKQMIFGVILILLAVLMGLSFFKKAGILGEYFVEGSLFLIGNTVFLIPLIFVLAGIIFLIFKKEELTGKEKKISWPVILAVLISILGVDGILGSISPALKRGGWLGYLISWPFLKFLGFWATQVIFWGLIIVSFLIFWYLFGKCQKKEKSLEIKEKVKTGEKKPSIIKRIFTPKFKVKEISDLEENKNFPEKETAFTKKVLKSDSKSLGSGVLSPSKSNYQPPSIKLLEADQDRPTSGDIKVNSAIIKKTLQDFGIEVTMSEVNIGPTVTQYTLKPAEGVKLAKITSLANDLSLALASHPIRIEAPIPGRSLAGIEVPNKKRAQVRLRNLIEDPNFQKSSEGLIIALGRDVSGFPVYVDLVKMPHLLVAGSTGTGKTIFLNSLILSLLYQPTSPVKSASPENLRFILVDPKRVEFSVYSELPHLLCPVVYTAEQTIGVLKWLTAEMERRFALLFDIHARNIESYNEKLLKGSKITEGVPLLPYIVVVIDELADLMAARGKEIEAGIVRLAQMARAVGIHLVVATQRPSVEVITGLIKANITARIAFRVASQIDSRTIFDSAGAEKLLGSGDMLYISALTSKPKRIQGAYVSEKEVKRVVEDLESRSLIKDKESGFEEELVRFLDSSVIEKETREGFYEDDEDPLYEEAKRTVIEMRRASASLLQRKLKIGYARAARLIDILEAKGVVGPADGAKPREVYIKEEEEIEKGEDLENQDNNDNSNNNQWQKV